jgi:hypothetical protein
MLCLPMSPFAGNVGGVYRGISRTSCNGWPSYHRICPAAKGLFSAGNPYLIYKVVLGHWVTFGGQSRVISLSGVPKFVNAHKICGVHDIENMANSVNVERLSPANLKRRLANVLRRPLSRASWLRGWSIKPFAHQRRDSEWVSPLPVRYRVIPRRRDCGSSLPSVNSISMGPEWGQIF